MTSTETLTNIFGCDSLITTTTLVFSNIPINEDITLPTCDASQGGMMSTEIISSISGCDSVIITTTLDYTAPINESLTASTCDPGQDGMTSIETLTNIFGCDSLITTTTLVFTPPIDEMGTIPTCDPLQAGNTSTNTILNVSGCDSVVITITAILIEATTTNLMATTCDPNEVGISSEMLIGSEGCDSLVITETTLADINLCSVQAMLSTNPISCGDSQGDISVTVEVGTGPFMVSWESNSTGPLGSIEIFNRGETEIISDLDIGTYTITVLTANGLEWSQIIFLEEEESFVVNLFSEPIGNGFELTCADSEDGSIQTEIIGIANSPISYQWSNGQTGETLINVAAGVYSVTVTDVRGCTAAGSGEITGPPIMQVFLTGMDLTCFGENDGVVAIDTIIGGMRPFEFTFANQTTIQSPVWFDLSPGHYEVVVTDDNGCSGIGSTMVNTPSPVVVDLGPDLEVALGMDVTIEFQSNVIENNLDTVLWNGPDIVDCENCMEQALTPLFSGSYGVTVVDTSGCSGMDEINIQVIKERAVYIPNVFSPNGDGNNDRFFISTSGEVAEILKLNIYNRWGAVVFSNLNFSPNDPDLGWDGVFKEQGVNSGVFVYHAKIRFVDGEEIDYSGDVTILK